MKISREEIIWAAGFFDGEGNVHVGTITENGHQYKILRVQVGQTDKQVLNRFQKALFGLGKIYGPYKSNHSNGSLHWQFRSAKFEHSQAIIAALYSFLSPVKQQQAITALRKKSE